MLWNTLSQEEQDKRLQAQSKMEKESFQYGIQKYWKEYDRSPDEGLPEQQLLDQVVMELSPTIRNGLINSVLIHAALNG